MNIYNKRKFSKTTVNIIYCVLGDFSFVNLILIFYSLDLVTLMSIECYRRTASAQIRLLETISVITPLQHLLLSAISFHLHFSEIDTQIYFSQPKLQYLLLQENWRNANLLTRISRGTIIRNKGKLKLVCWQFIMTRTLSIIWSTSTINFLNNCVCH